MFCYKMVQKQTNVWVSDHSGASWVHVFHLYRGFWRRTSSYGDYIKGSVKKIAFYPKYIWGKKYKPLRVGYVVRGLLTQLKFSKRFFDNTRCSFRKNSVILLKKKEVFKSQTFYGPLVRLVKKKKYYSLFNCFI